MTDDERDENDEARLKETKELVRSVLKDVHEEYFDWEQEYCTAAIAELTVVDEEDVSDEEESSSMPLARVESYVVSWEGVLNSMDPQNVYVYPHRRTTDDSGDEGISPTYTMSTETRCILRASALDPCSAYEFCVTSSRNLHIGDDSSTLNFNPFAGVPFKDFEEYAQLHKNFAWQLKRTDTDQENIILEATYRLIRYHDLTLRDIGGSGALIGFISSLDEPLKNYGELLKRLSLRDILHWKWPHIATHEIPQANTAPEALNIATRFETMMKAFCANLNCIETYCSPHADFSSPSGRPVHEESHKIPEPCGPHCFMLETKEDEIFMLDGARFKEIQATYKQIVTVCPELTTCQLAVACWCKCKEDRPDVTLIHIVQGASTPRVRAKLVEEPVTGSRRRKKTEDYVKLFDSAAFVPDNPCDHDGPCDRRHNCACYKNKSYCEKGCRCSPSCTRRHPGCNCKLQAWNKLSCTSERCPCVKAWRECDPERCTPCKAHYHDGSGCYNAQIQAKASKAVIVQESQFGLGLFLRETAKKDALITEYVGELVFESSIASRDCVSKARNRNYVYELNNEISIDAGGFGNEARFINHSSNPNCSARSLLVNGEHRIGIYSGNNSKKEHKPLRPGTELLLDYGDVFFAKKKK